MIPAAVAGWAVGTGTLRIGVTGHRFLSDAQLVARQIDECLQHLTPGVRAGERRLLAVSSLAEGADRLLAQAVLARPGGALEAALPLPPEDYLRDFATVASREEFASLLLRARAVIVLPPAPTRDEAYARAGRYVVAHCDMLLAIWDGRPARGPGGTAETVDHARRTGRPLVWIRTQPPGPAAAGLASPATLE